jgi:hypothetical protein
MKAYAYVNHGRWVVECPSPTCRSAELVAPGGSKKLRCMCPDQVVCAHPKPVAVTVNRSAKDGTVKRFVCGQRIEPLFPPDHDEIEEVLGMRPTMEARNWYPGETVPMLVAENLEHGDPAAVL